MRQLQRDLDTVGDSNAQSHIPRRHLTTELVHVARRRLTIELVEPTSYAGGGEQAGDQLIEDEIAAVAGEARAGQH